jgi:hypothetical protein
LRFGWSRLAWNSAHVSACKARDIIYTRQRERPYKFLAEQDQSAVYTGFSSRSAAVMVRPAD